MVKDKHLDFFELMNKWKYSKFGYKHKKQIEKRMIAILKEKNVENDKDFLLSVFKINNMPVFLKKTVKSVAEVAFKTWSDKLLKELSEQKGE